MEIWTLNTGLDLTEKEPLVTLAIESANPILLSYCGMNSLVPKTESIAGAFCVVKASLSFAHHER